MRVCARLNASLGDRPELLEQALEPRAPRPQRGLDRVGYKAPEEIVVFDEMPLNSTSKIDRVGLKRLAEDHLHPHGLD